MTTLTLDQARKLIAGCFSSLPAEEVSLHEAAGRVAARSLKAAAPVPAFARASMDGYAVRSRDLFSSGTESRFAVAGEIAAGCTELPPLTAGRAVRIMTGAAVPPGADQVVPCEQCRQEGNLVLTAMPPRPGACIRARGADLGKGRVMLRAGALIEPQHLPLLAESGLASVPVAQLPEVGVLSTGSELLDPASSPQAGQIIGGNRFLLAALLRRNGALCHDLGLVRDEPAELVARLREALAGPGRCILTTGGMGPGKYDLMPRAFAALGISPLYTALAVRPGRSTMLGFVGEKAIFALPGPPPAVFLLFHELVLPALARMQGLRQSPAPLVQATLTEPLLLKKTGILNLKGAVVRLRGSVLYARPTLGAEPAGAIIHVPAGRSRLRAGETIRLRLVAGAPRG